MKKIQTVACLGAGVIGASWAACFASRGCGVRLYDIKEEFLTDAQRRIRRDLEFLSEKGFLTAGDVERAMARIEYTTSLAEAVKDADFIQESGPENYDVKRSIMEAVDRFAPQDAIYASSTSGLLITEIAKASKYPQRCLGGHPYNPPLLIPLVEITKGERTSQEAVDAAKAFYAGIGKEPIVLNRETLGFIANRLQIALAREATDLVHKGVCSIEDVDKAVCFGPGLRWAIMGPNLVNQLAGGAGGFRHAHEHMSPSAETWLADMATWSKFPEGWSEFAQKGVLEEMAHRDPACGRTNEEIIRFRDNMLLEILRLHGKL